MFYLIHLLTVLLLPSGLQWLLPQESSVDPVGLGPQDTAKALSAIAAILLIGLGAVLIISLSGRWVRRWVFFDTRNSSDRPSADSKLGKLDWARPPADTGKKSVTADLHSEGPND